MLSVGGASAIRLPGALSRRLREESAANVHELVPNLRTGLRDGISFDRRMKRFRYPHSLDKQIAPVILAIALPPFTLWVFYETLFEGGFPNRNGPRAPLPLSIFFVYGICIMAAVGLSLGGRAMLAYVEISEDAITQRSWWVRCEQSGSRISRAMALATMTASTQPTSSHLRQAPELLWRKASTNILSSFPCSRRR